METRNTEYHADDYGLFPAQSRRILACIRDGACSGISIMPNSPYLEECMGYLEPYRDRVRIAAHLNLVEGKALSPAEEVPLLTDRDGIFNISYGMLLLVSFLPGFYQSYLYQIKKEFRAQMRRAYPFMHKNDIRLDSHVHYHMIPVVFDAMLKAAKEEGLAISYIRIPEEDLTPYRREFTHLRGKKPVNLVKALLLNTLSGMALKKHGSHPALRRKGFFAGVVLSGQMRPENADRLLPLWTEAADNSGASYMELLFHPGGVKEKEDIANITDKGDRAFLTDNARRAEAVALMKRRS